MSGGSLDYVYHRVEDVAHNVLIRAETPLHRAFGAHLLKVAKALHDLEWVWSGDTGPGSEVDAITAVVTRSEIIEVVTARANEALRELQSVLDTSSATQQAGGDG